MTFKKIAIPLLIVAVLMTVVLLFVNSDAGLQVNEKIVTTISLDENMLDFAMLTEGSDLIIEGFILRSYVFTKPLHDNQTFPDIYTKYEVMVTKVLKGETEQNTITIVTHGGQFNDRISVTDAVPIKNKDMVILFLEKNGTHYTDAEEYNPIAPIQGVFLVKDDIVKSGAYSDISKSDLIVAIDTAKRN
ncbi:MAG: hypothetical protein OXC46_11550 [Thaumarchaeota archaeon]|nr:hypothetical protein [Nitrososphaerota archaeon]